MSADKILGTQNYSQQVTKHAGAFDDPFRQTKAQRKSVIRNSAVRRREINFPQPFAFGNKTLSVRVPQVDYLGDMYIVLKTGALAGQGASWNAKWASQAIQSFRLRNAGRLLQEHTHAPAVYNYMIDRCDDEKRRQLEKFHGAASAAAQTVVIPVMTFWSSWMQDNIEKGKPLQYGRLSGSEGIVLEIVTGTFDRCCSTNPSSDPVVSASLVFSEMLTEADLMSQHKKEPWVYAGRDFKCRGDVALSADVEKQVDVTALTGCTSHYYISLTANEAFTDRLALDELSLDVDGREYQKVATKEEIAADNLCWGGLGCNSDSQQQNYLLLGVDAGQGHRGHLNSRDAKDIRMKMKGPAGTADILAVQDVAWEIKNGSIYRYE